MTAFDPYRTLGIDPGASQAEIKSAYRRLAKLYHPDSAGERALSRFLAIQAAYEALVDETGRKRPTGRTTPGRATPTPSPAWQADASRARATREAYRARTRRAGGSTGTSGGAAAGGGAEARGRGGAGGAAGAGESTGPDAGTHGAAGAAAGDAGTGAAGGTGTGTGSGGRSRRSSRKTKATIGSTSYDGADREPFDPAWEGATWYGAGSGTYWTINPKEYADPRKHGPEYLARSRRATGPSTAAPGSGEAPSGADPSPAGDSRSSAGAPPPSPTAEGSSAEEASADHDAPAQRPSRPSADPPVAAARPARPTAPLPGPFVAAAGAAGPPRSSELQRAAATMPGRVIAALLGWIPIAVALAALTEAVPVCGGMATVCSDPLTGGIWVVDLAVIALLVAIPRLGWIAAIGSAAFFVVGIVATPVLLVLGGTRTPTGTASALTVVLVVAWLAGIALALSGRVDLPPWRRRRVR
jgi:hypothetical protein